MSDEYRYHKKNTHFDWQQLAAKPSTLSTAQVSQYHAEGGFILEQGFTAAELASVVAETDRLEAQAHAILNEQMNEQTAPAISISRAEEIVFNPHLVAASTVLKAFAQHPLLAGIARDLLGSQVRLYWDQLVYKHGNTHAEFPWHQDNGYTYVEPQQYLTCWVALNSATTDNGCPWIAPGIHKQGTLHHTWTDLGFQCFVDYPDAKPMPLQAGQIAVFSSLTPHRTGPNHTADTRKAYILQYAPDGALMHPHNQEPIRADNPDWQFPVVIDDAAVNA